MLRMDTRPSLRGTRFNCHSGRNFQESFGKAVSGYDVPQDVASRRKDWHEPNKPLHRTEQNFAAAGPAITTRRPVVHRLALERNVVLEEYEFSAAHARRPVRSGSCPDPADNQLRSHLLVKQFGME